MSRYVFTIFELGTEGRLPHSGYPGKSIPKSVRELTASGDSASIQPISDTLLILGISARSVPVLQGRHLALEFTSWSGAGGAITRAVVGPGANAARLLPLHGHLHGW